MESGCMDQAAMQRWQDAATAGPMHELLASRVGKWKTTTKVWMNPAGEPSVSEGEAVIEPVLGGRFTRETSRGSMMGMPVESIYYLGYNNVRKQFVTCSFSGFGTGITVGQGALSFDKKTLTFIAEMDEPMTGEIGKAVQCTIQLVDNDTNVMSLHEILYGQPFRVVEITYHRVK